MRKSIICVIIIVLLISICTPFASAACSHSWGTTYSRAEHPHQFYRTCGLCGYVDNMPYYATKNHGNGVYGSGTCPSCGTHNYVFTSCSSPRYCACGGSLPATGHNYTGATVYSDATHPHQQYRHCINCSYKSYLGTYVTKTHGNGVYGSGTCPSCGTHSYTGTCTTQRICACGDWLPPTGHVFTGSATYSDGSHPHAEFKYCLYCPYKNYLGTYATKNHGAGVSGSGTCPSCGTHDYDPMSIDFTAYNTHPHPWRILCICGASHEIRAISMHPDCATCSTYPTVTNSATGLISIPIIDDDQGLGSLHYEHVPIVVQYQETINKASGKFYSYWSRATCTTTNHGIDYINITNQVSYYSSSGGIVYNQTLDGPVIIMNGTYSLERYTPRPFVIESLPAYSKLVCLASTFGMYAPGYYTLTTYY